MQRFLPGLTKGAAMNLCELRNLPRQEMMASLPMVIFQGVILHEIFFMQPKKDLFESTYLIQTLNDNATLIQCEESRDYNDYGGDVQYLYGRTHSQWMAFS